MAEFTRWLEGLHLALLSGEPVEVLAEQAIRLPLMHTALVQAARQALELWLRGEWQPRPASAKQAEYNLLQLCTELRAPDLIEPVWDLYRRGLVSGFHDYYKLSPVPLGAMVYNQRGEPAEWGKLLDGMHAVTNGVRATVAALFSCRSIRDNPVP